MIWRKSLVVGSVVLVSMLFSAVAPAVAGKEKTWGPQVTASNPKGVKRSKLQGVAGPTGRTVKCNGRPLLLGPGVMPPGLRGVEFDLDYDGESLGASPSFVPRCAGKGKVAWYLTQEDPLRNDRKPGAPIVLSVETPPVTTSAGKLGNVVHTGACYPRDGVMPPCVPDIPKTVNGPRVTTPAGTRAVVSGQVKLRGEQIDGQLGGSARVSVQLKLDGEPAGDRKEILVSGGVAVSIPIEAQLSLSKGSHRISLEITGSGYNFVNVKGESARFETVFAKTFKLR